MKKSLSEIWGRSGRAFLLAGCAALLLSCPGCSSTRVAIEDQELARVRINEPILLFPPLTSNPRWNIIAKDLGKCYRVELPKRTNGGVVYANDVASLVDAQSWNNLIKNGGVNMMEAAAIGKNLGCNSVMTVQILDMKLYPPFRIVVNLLWIDSSTGNILGKLFQDIDVTDSETEYRYKSFVGQGVGQEVYEKIMYSKDHYQTAYLMPQSFYHFAAAYSTRILFGDVSDFPWWFFWRSI